MPSQTPSANVRLIAFDLIAFVALAAAIALAAAVVLIATVLLLASRAEAAPADEPQQETFRMLALGGNATPSSRPRRWRLA